MTQAVEEAAAGGCQFDVILMDMCMPVLGGVEATQEIRGLGCGVPIVAMTANASERDRVECIAAGMDGFLRWVLGRMGGGVCKCGCSAWLAGAVGVWYRRRGEGCRLTLA